MTSLQGHFLVASPKLADGNFNRSVVLIIKHDDEGAFGLILNRPTGNTVKEIWKLISEGDLPCDDPIFVGGPVAGPLLALHRLKSCSEAEVLPGVYFAAHKDKMVRIVAQANKPFRLFTGYAGWAGGQLEGEMQVGGWLTLPATKELVFSAHDNLWDQVIRTIGEGILAPALKTKHVPIDPSLN
jgi:putative transcriptional regulator